MSYRYSDLTFRAFAENTQPPAVNFALGTSTPNTSTRAYAAYRETISGGLVSLVSVASNVLRTSERLDSDGLFFGYHVEPEATNDIDENNDFAGWTKEDAGDVIADDAADGPGSGLTAATLVCDATDGNHGISLATANNLAAVDNCMSIWVGAGNADWVQLVDSTVANAHCWFNVSTGAVGTRGAGSDQASFVLGQYVGDADRRIHIRFTGTVAPHTLLIRPCDGDGVDTFSGGDGAATTLYLSGAQCEAGDYPTSRIDTNGASATRLKDQLQYKGDDGNLGGVGSEGRGSIEFDILLPDKDVAVYSWMFVLSDGAAATDRLGALCALNDAASMFSRKTAGNNGDTAGSIDLADGERHRIRITWSTNNLRVYVDGILDGSDFASADIPVNLDRIDIGQSRAFVSQLNGLISDLKIWRRNKVR